jgi:type I restriction enzyme S subunit
VTVISYDWTSSAPVHWTQGRLKDLIDSAVNGVWGDDPREDGTDVYCVRAADFDRQRQRVSMKKLPLRQLDARTKVRHLLQKGDLILEKSGGGEAQPVGAVVLFDLGVAAVCSNFSSSLRPARDVDAQYLTYVMAAAYSIGLSESAVKQTAGIQNLDAGAFFAEKCAIPQIDEQRRIADFLDYELSRLMLMAHACRSLRRLLEERRWAAVHAAVTGGDRAEPLRPCSLGWARTLTSAWPVVPLKYVARLGSGHTPSRTHPEYWENCSIPWISLFDVGRMRDPRQEYIAETEQKISEVGMANSSACLHSSGSVVLSRTASVGFSAIMATDMAVSQHFVTWACGPRLKPEYLLFVLRSMRQYFASVQVGTTNVTVFMPDLYSIKIPLPSLVEQEQIIARVRERIAAIDELDDGICRESSLLEERRRALITAAVTGQIDVATTRGVAG